MMFFCFNLFLQQMIKIETYWNVNEATNARTKNKKDIKIETYWNVNKVKKI